MPSQYTPAKRRQPQSDGRKLSAILTVTKPSVVPVVAGPSVALALWAIVVTLAWHWSPAGQWLRALPSSQLLITLLGVVMGLLLVFRTNTAYDRFYEGRRVWATAHSNIRSLARLIWVGVKATDPVQVTNHKRGAMNLLIAFAAATKHHMRREDGFLYDDLGPYLAHIPAFALDSQSVDATNNAGTSSSPINQTGTNTAALPIEIIFRLQKYIKECKDTSQIDANIQLVLSTNANTLADCISTFERIRTTPIPIAYELHLKQTLIVYLLSLPFQIVTVLQWYTIPATLVAAFTMFGIEAIGGEIENPFGFDANDLPQDEFVDTIRDEVQSMMG
ncbi:Bestrophin/UPF0187 [Obelidium mucronatum]|nr:Bestrophin/UPF0187 [Obelidium mucronatum]